MLSQSPAGLITDIDGTIAPITPTPEETVVSTVCRAALANLVGKIDLVAVLTGRSVVKARDMVGIEGVVFVGNHGLERWKDGDVEVVAEAREYQPLIRGVAERLRREVDMPGLVIEDKGVSASVHYRLSNAPSRAKEAIFYALDRLDEARGLLISEGKLVVEIRPPVRVDKGTSLRKLVEEHGLKGVVCMGDDVTDVDAFKAVHVLSARGTRKGLALGVVGSDTPQQIIEEADFLLRGVGEVEELLQRISGM